MNKNEIYKAGRNDAAESYKRRYEELADREKAMIEKQEQQNETNHKIQQQLIENEERMDKDLDKIYQILGEERVAGTSGDAIIDENSSNLITTYTNGALNKYNSFSNLEAIEFDTQVVDAVATFLTTAVEKDMNKKFHNSLSVLEQNGIISQEKFEQHKNSVVMAKQVAGLGVYAAFSLAPIICNSISNYLKKVIL